MPLLTTSHDVLLVLVFSCQHLTLSRRAVTSPRASPDSLPSLYHCARPYSYSSNIASTTAPQHERSRGKICRRMLSLIEHGRQASQAFQL
jgi:hypothetical protein